MSVANPKILKEKSLTINETIVPNEMPLVKEMIKGKGPKKISC